MNVNDAFPSKYIKADDLKDKAIKVCIDSYEIETVGQGEDAEEKPVLYFRDKKKGLVLNITNARMIADRFGGEMDNWTGKEIELYGDRVPFGGKIVDAIRVRHVIPPAAEHGTPDENPFD